MIIINEASQLPRNFLNLQNLPKEPPVSQNMICVVCPPDQNIRDAIMKGLTERMRFPASEVVFVLPQDRHQITEEGRKRMCIAEKLPDGTVNFQVSHALAAEHAATEAILEAA